MCSLVSVIIPAYNAAAHIDRTIRSVREQSYPQELIEVVIVNDGSTDRTAEVIDRYAKEYKIIHTPNQGVSLARQTGLGAAAGAYIQYLDSDDLLHPNKIRLQVKALEANDADVAYGDWEKFKEDASGAIVVTERIARRIEGRPVISTFTDFWCPPAALLYSKRITDIMGFWNRSLPIIQDARYLWEAAHCRGRFVYTPGVVAQYRVAEGQSLSTRYGNLRFMADVFENARQVYVHWQADLPDDPEKRAALLKVLYQCTRVFYEHDKRQFEECLRLLQEIGGRDFIPDRPAVLKALSTLLGYRQAEYVALQYRKLKGKLNRNEIA